MQTPKSDALYTYADLAALTKIPLGTLRQLVTRKRLPHVRVGPRTVRFDPAVIHAWLASRAVEDAR